MKTLKHILPLEWQFSQLALEKASEAIFGVDAKANIYRVNEAACRYLGYSRKELTRLKIFDIDPNYTPQNWPEITQKIKNDGVLVFESSIRAKSGNFLPSRLRPTILNLTAGIIIARTKFSEKTGGNTNG